MPEPVRLAVVASSLAVGGAEQLLLDLLTRLDRDRFAISLGLLQADSGPVGREIAKLGLPTVTGLRRGRLDPLCPWRIWRWLMQRQATVLLAINHLDVLLYGLPAAKAAHIPFVNWENETGPRFAARTLPMALRRLALAHVDMVVAAANGHKAFIEQEEGVLSERIALIPNGVDPSRATTRLSPAEARGRLDIAPDAPVVIQVAALRPDKNHELMFTAFRLVQKRLPGAILLLAGDGPRRQELTALAERSGLGRSCRFLGVCREVGDVLAAADVFALSSSGYQETLSVAAIEAMFAGLPLVATAVGSMDELVLEGQTGRLVPPGDPTALADALVELLASPETARHLGQNAARLARERYDIETMGAGFTVLLERLGTAS